MVNIQQDMLTLHEDSFEKYFHPYSHEHSNHNIWGGIGLEAYGSDFKLVKHLPSAHMWTVVDDGDSADQWILPGIHTVNRICFLVTKVPHNWCDIEFRIPSRGYSLSSLGLLRQVNKIKKKFTL